jgi:hypothetical protein
LGRANFSPANARACFTTSAAENAVALVPAVACKGLSWRTMAGIQEAIEMALTAFKKSRRRMHQSPASCSGLRGKKYQKCRAMLSLVSNSYAPHE